MTALITRAECRASNACYSDAELDAFIPAEGIRPSELVSLIGETRAGRTLTPEDCHWALCNGVPDPDLYAREYRIHACWCARRELARCESPDKRSVNAVAVAERLANGQATKDELSAARDVARDVAWYAAWYAARNAAWYAAMDAARDAARDVAIDAERLEQCRDLAQRLEGA